MRIRPIIAALTLGATACSWPSGGLFSLGPRPADLSGAWIDSAKTTISDSSIWVLAPNGADGTLRIRIVAEPNGATHVERDDTRYGSWYLQGTLSDTEKRALCFKRRPRDGASCVRFRLDTISFDHGMRRRLTIFGYRGERTTADRILLERLP